VSYLFRPQRILIIFTLICICLQKVHIIIMFGIRFSAVKEYISTFWPSSNIVILIMRILVKFLLVVHIILFLVIIFQMINIFSVLLVIKPLSWRVWLFPRIEIVLWQLAIIVLLMLCIILICLLLTRLFFWLNYLITYFQITILIFNLIFLTFTHLLSFFSILDLQRWVIQLFFVRYAFLIDQRSRWGACVIHYGWRVIN